MPANLLSLYHALPGPLRNTVASLKGYQLKRWRYSRETDVWAREASERERWSQAQWHDWLQSRLPQILQQAVQSVPYYRDYWASQKGKAGPQAYLNLENWPILTKEVVRQHPRDFLSDDCDPRKMIHEHTSGTTGTPLDLWQTKSAARLWYAIYEARTRGWNGVSRHDRWGILGAQKVVSPQRRKPPFWVWNAALKQLYLSAAHLAPWSSLSYIDAIEKYRLRYLLGYTNSLAYLAHSVLETGRKVELKVVITNGEPLSDVQRKTIQEAFNCPVCETYGMSEIACGAAECEAGTMHIWPDVGIIEIVDDAGNPVPAGNAGRIVATGLINGEMPLIRYDTRDRGSVPAVPKPCPCGRQLPALEKIYGRYDDVIITKDGRRLVQFDGIFDSGLHIKEGQIIQKSLEQFLVKVVPAAGWTDKDADQLRLALTRRLGEATVTIEPTAFIERTWAGKFRVIVSEMPQ